MRSSPKVPFSLVAACFSLLIAGAALTASAAMALPPGYAYEQVSPVDKRGSYISPTGNSSENGALAAASGNAVMFSSIATVLDDSATSSPLMPLSLSSFTGQGWGISTLSAHTADQPGIINFFPFEIPQLSAELDRALFTSLGGAPGSDPTTGDSHYPGAWIRDNRTGIFTRIVPEPVVGGAPHEAPPSHTVADPGLDTVVYATTAELTSDAVSLDDFTKKIYRWRGGELDLIGAGTPIPMPGGGRLDAPYFQGPDELLYRSDGVDTSWVDQEEDPVSDPPSGGWTGTAQASFDGDRLAFVSLRALTPGDPSGNGFPQEEDVYLYDHARPADENLTLLTEDHEPSDGVDTRGELIKVSSDGHRVYFAAASQIIAGGPTTPLAPGNPEKAGQAERYVYLWEDSSGTPVIKYVGIIGCPEIPHCSGAAGLSPWRISPDGTKLAFISETPALTPDDDGNVSQIYLYDASASGLLSPAVTCASCGGVASAPVGQPELNLGMINTEVTSARDTRNVSDDGRVVFMSRDPLVTGDINGKRDVYLYTEGKPQLITTGRSATNNVFVDSSSDLKKVFFGTEEQLVGWDDDSVNDIYVAKLGGGLPEPEPSRPGCEGDECQNEGVAATNHSKPGSSAFAGGGNQSANCAALQRRAASRARKARQAERRAKRATGESKREARKKARKAKQDAKGPKRRATACSEAVGS